MENHDVYTPAQESEIEAAYADFYQNLSQEKWGNAQSIINGMEGKEFFKVADDMKKELAAKKLHA